MSLRAFMAVLVLATLAAGSAWAEEKQSAYDRVIKSGVIRCAYGTAEPAFYKDQKTGQMSGFYYEILEEAAKLLSLKIEYVAEPGYAEFIAGLQSGRYDAFCAMIGIVPSRARVSVTSIPLAYNAQVVYVREGEKRFKTPADLNKPAVKMATTDGESFQILTRRFFPKAIEHNLPNATPPAQLLLDIAMGKADAVLYDPIYISGFNRNNPDKKLVPAFDKPMSIAPSSVFTVLPHELPLVNMMNVAFQTLHDNGKVEEILTKYDIGPDVLYRMKPRYQDPLEK
jgi:polar amino acid transport system substrate-binding protein